MRDIRPVLGPERYRWRMAARMPETRRSWSRYTVERGVSVLLDHYATFIAWTM